MAKSNRYFVLGSVRSLFLWFLLHVLLINASPTALVPTERRASAFPKFAPGYNGRIEKGQYFNKLFPLNEEKAAEFNGGVTVASPFKDPSALKSNGWTRYIYWYPFKKNTGDPRSPWRPKYIDRAWRLGLRISKSPEYGHDLDNAFAERAHPVDQREAATYTYRHDRKFDKNKKPTYSHYANVHVPASGAIIFDNDFSPETFQKEWKLGDIPKLHRVSDVVFFQWIDACKTKNVDPKSLKVMFISHVLNPETYNIVVDALWSAGHRRMPNFANKVVFSMDTPEGQAILGSTWGSALSYMLIQHKKELGLKKITEVAVWGLRLGFTLPTERDRIVGTMEMRFVVEDA
ncbi:hypothetical protein LY76DRAFT_659246 [Colletotrichum caudatum]|nr:hypothetical protein LY76DRAFT_659246 [Colletotrichum caudatum]